MLQKGFLLVCHISFLLILVSFLINSYKGIKIMLCFIFRFRIRFTNFDFVRKQQGRARSILTHQARFKTCVYEISMSIKIQEFSQNISLSIKIQEFSQKYCCQSRFKISLSKVLSLSKIQEWVEILSSSKIQDYIFI